MQHFPDIASHEEEIPQHLLLSALSMAVVQTEFQA
jgi:hypothetical protein